MDMFNTAVLAMASNDLATAKVVLFDDKTLLSPTRPDMRSRTLLERGIYNIMKKDDGWKEAAITELRKAVCADGKLKQVILSDETLADPGNNKAQEYGWEKGLLQSNANGDFLKSLKETFDQVPDRCS